MQITPPFYLRGESGQPLGAGLYLMADLGITDAVLTLRSLDADVLQFSLRRTANAVPADGQEISLVDDVGLILLVGRATRTFRYPQGVYNYQVTGVYKGLMETPLLNDSGRPYLVYETGDLGVRLRDILNRAQSSGLQIQAPSASEMPALYTVPKMAFRAATHAGAIEDVFKWIPDTSTRMDYTANPPKLIFSSRAQTTAITIDLDADDHKATSVSLESLADVRALYISFSYARRVSSTEVVALTQSAGDPDAEATRKISVFLSGVERSDYLASEALNSAQIAIDKVNEVIVATAAAVDAAAASAGLPISWETCVARNTTLQALAAAYPSFSMSPSSGETIELYTNSAPYSSTKASKTGTALTLRDVSGNVAAGWYPIKTGAFTDAQLATAGAIKETRYIRGDLFSEHQGAGKSDGQAYLETNDSGNSRNLSGWITQTYSSSFWDIYRRYYLWYYVNIPVDAINMSPSAVAAAINAAGAGAEINSFITRAEFVEAPEGLASNYFSRQDWTPYKGSVTFAPSVSNIPVPGDFLNLRADDAPAEWATMAAPVYETEIDLQSGSSRVGIGPSPRQDFKTLLDRLRIPPEDNYTEG